LIYLIYYYQKFYKKKTKIIKIKQPNDLSASTYEMSDAQSTTSSVQNQHQHRKNHHNRNHSKTSDRSNSSQSRNRQHHSKSKSHGTSNDKSRMATKQKQQGEKIQSLKNQIEKQMQIYAKEEEYEEMIKLIKKLNLISTQNWEELETEVDKLEYSDIEYRPSTAGFLTDDEIAVLANEINLPQRTKHINDNSQHHHTAPSSDNEKTKNGKTANDNKKNPLPFDFNDIHSIKNNYGHKRNILKKLMIAQRRKFIMKKEQVDMDRMRDKLADTSISNFSQASIRITHHPADKKAEKLLTSINNDSKTNKHDENNTNNMSDENIKLLYDVWDTARIVNTDESYEQRVHFFHLSLQILKVITYIVLSIIVIITAILSKGSFLLMTNAVGNVKTVNIFLVSDFFFVF
jgi:hypothetical protein